MLPGQHILRRVPAGDGPQVAGTLGRLHALAEMRINGQIVSHRVLPAVVVRFVVGKAIAERHRVWDVLINKVVRCHPQTGGLPLRVHQPCALHKAKRAAHWPAGPTY